MRPSMVFDTDLSDTLNKTPQISLELILEGDLRANLTLNDESDVLILLDMLVNGFLIDKAIDTIIQPIELNSFYWESLSRYWRDTVLRNIHDEVLEFSINAKDIVSYILPITRPFNSTKKNYIDSTALSYVLSSNVFFIIDEEFQDIIYPMFQPHQLIKHILDHKNSYDDLTTVTLFLTRLVLAIVNHLDEFTERSEQKLLPKIGLIPTKDASAGDAIINALKDEWFINTLFGNAYDNPTRIIDVIQTKPRVMQRINETLGEHFDLKQPNFKPLKTPLEIASACVRINDCKTCVRNEDYLNGTKVLFYDKEYGHLISIDFKQRINDTLEISIREHSNGMIRELSISDDFTRYINKSAAKKDLLEAQISNYHETMNTMLKNARPLMLNTKTLELYTHIKESIRKKSENNISEEALLNSRGSVDIINELRERLLDRLFETKTKYGAKATDFRMKITL